MILRLKASKKLIEKKQKEYFVQNIILEVGILKYYLKAASYIKDAIIDKQSSNN